MARVHELVKLEMTERDLAWELEKQLRQQGADAVAFPIIVASGPNGAYPHHEPGDRRLVKGDQVIVDLGARLDGYHSDLTRTFYLGRQPSTQFSEIYGIVLRAQEAALSDLSSEMSGAAADRLSRDIIAAAGYAAEFGHSLGHGVGLEVHELPRLSQREPEANVGVDSVVTVEPGIYVPGWGGVRIEDLVMVTEDGPELLSHCAKDPYIAI